MIEVEVSNEMCGRGFALICDERIDIIELEMNVIYLYMLNLLGTFNTFAEEQHIL